MARALLDICEDAVNRIGLEQPRLIATADRPLARQLRAHLEAAARDMIRREDWPVMERVHSFTSVAAESQLVMSTSVPDFKRMVDNTFINTTSQVWYKPIDPTEHARLDLYGGPIGLNDRYRIRGDEILFPQNTTGGESCRFEYISSWYTKDSTGIDRKARPTADDDLILLDDEAIILGTIWRWKAAKGLEYGESFNDYERHMQELVGSKIERQPLSMSPSISNSLHQSPIGLVIPTS
jgi:hypothetical protein